jgi:hypothetical protein
MPLKIKRFHRSWYVKEEVYMSDSDTVRPEFLDLYMKFRRNRVWLQVIPDGDIEAEDEDEFTALLEHRIVNSLENNCTGFWTAEKDEESRDGLSLYFMFEHEEDLLHFLRTDGLMFRLEV